VFTNSSSDSTRLGNRGPLAVILAGICFGTTGTAQQLGAKTISPLAVGSARLLCGALFMFIFWKFTSQQKEKPKIPGVGLFVSALGVGGYQLAFFSSVRMTGVATATLIALGTSPIFTGVISFIHARTKLGFRWIRATVITTIGITLLSGAHGFAAMRPGGVVMALLAGFSFALFNVSSKSLLIQGIASSYLMARIFLLASLLIFPILFTANPRWLITSHGAITVIWLGLVPTAMAYFLYSFGLHRVTAHTASTLVLAEPATATILAAFVLHESLSIESLIGIAFVALGLIHLSRSSQIVEPIF